MRVALVTMLLVARVGSALAQSPAPAPVATPPAPVPAPVEPAGQTEVTLTPNEATPAACMQLDLTPGAYLQPTARKNELATPIPWSEFDIDGHFVDRKEVVRALLEPTLTQLRTSLSRATLPELAQLTARFGYQLVGQRTVDISNGAKLVLMVEPLPLVRRVHVNVHYEVRRSLFGILDKLIEDDVQRRMGIRPGAYLPWESVRRKCALAEERRRIEEFLFDQGYFDATVDVTAEMEGGTAHVIVEIDLHRSYKIGRVTIACPQGYTRRKGTCFDPGTGAPYVLAVPDYEIKAVFDHERCLLGVCLGTARFSRDQYQKDLQALKDLFHARGYPAVRIASSDLAQSIEHKTRLVNPTLVIDQRRHVDVQFEGHNPDAISDDQLRKQLTFNDAGSADDVESAESARALTTYLQTRGYFDALVTWTRERIDVEPRPNTNDLGLHLDRITFHISTGHTRRVKGVEFAGNTKLKTATLAGLVATKEANIGGTFLGTVVAATSPELIADQERIKEAYRRAGYPEARVGTSAATSPGGLDNAALAAALQGTDDGNSLYVRFTIDEGPPTLLTRITAKLEGGGRPDPALCAEVLVELARQLEDPSIALPTDSDKCGVTIAGIEFKADDVAKTRDGLRDALFRNGRARARVEYTPVPIGPERIEAQYVVKNANLLRLGKVIIRGNFRTRQSVIYKQLDFDEGQLLTSDRLAEGARRLRNMGLFEAVNLDMPDLDCGADRQCTSETINAVVRVEERYDHRAEIGFEVGYSAVNGFFGTVRPILPNIIGRGLRLEVAGTYGQKLKEVDSRFRIPEYVPPLIGLEPPFNPNIELTGLYRLQDTPRFGLLKTVGAGIDLSKTLLKRQRTDTASAYSLTGGLFYQFRIRSRNLDALRPVGADMDQSQVAISTRTGLAGIRADFENRVDRNGQLSPLAPEQGWHASLIAGYASPELFGQDTFLKLSASISKFQPVGKNIVVRADLRYDQGFPLAGEVVLPEVERFFAGGDSTVRGYAEDRMETELIQVAVPPLDNVSQIRVLPAARNMRMLGSLDAQARIWKILAGALFTDAGILQNQWSTVTSDDIRPSVGMGLRALTPFGIGALEYAVPLRPRLGDDPRGRIHFYFAARAQF